MSSELTPVADYDVDGIAGRLFTAEIATRAALPISEIAETIESTALPGNLTYPEITPTLVSAVTAWRARRGHPVPEGSTAPSLCRVAADQLTRAGLGSSREGSRRAESRPRPCAATHPLRHGARG